MNLEQEEDLAEAAVVTVVAVEASAIVEAAEASVTVAVEVSAVAAVETVVAVEAVEASVTVAVAEVLAVDAVALALVPRLLLSPTIDLRALDRSARSPLGPFHMFPPETLSPILHGAIPPVPLVANPPFASRAFLHIPTWVCPSLVPFWDRSPC